MVAILQINHVSKTFKNDHDHVHVLDDLNFSVKNGEFISIIGPSGCGKSTLLKLIAGLDLDYEGDIIVGGQEVNAPSKDMRFYFSRTSFISLADGRKKYCR